MLSITPLTHTPGRSKSDVAVGWRVQLFGGLRVQACQDGEPLVLQGRQRDLLALLVCDSLRPRSAASRYCDALWPDSDGAAARSNLDSAIHRLRRSLGSPQAIHVSDGLVWLDPRLCVTDVGELAGIARQLESDGGASVAELCHRAAQVLHITAAGGLPPDYKEVSRPVAYLWRSVTRELVLRLDGAGRTIDAMRLCERYLTTAESDPGLLKLWVDMLERSGRSIAAEHVREEFGGPLLLM